MSGLCQSRKVIRVHVLLTRYPIYNIAKWYNYLKNQLQTLGHHLDPCFSWNQHIEYLVANINAQTSSQEKIQTVTGYQKDNDNILDIREQQCQRRPLT